MKRIFNILIALTLLICSVQGMPGSTSVSSGQDSLILITTPDLNELVAKWSSAYNKTYAGAPASVRSASGSSLMQTVKPGQIIFAGENTAGSIPAEGSDLRIVVAKNIVVPVVSSSNPLLDEIREKGVSPDEMKMLLGSEQTTWAKILSDGIDRNVKLHYLDDPLVINAVATLTGADKGSFAGTQHSDPAELLSAMTEDIYSLGFCRFSDIEGMQGKIAIVPVDRNGNGVIDSNEDIYSDFTAFTRGVWIGKYPKALCSNIFSVTATPAGEDVTAFLNWVITEGQDMLTAEGFTGLILTERISGAGRIDEARVPAPVSDRNQNIFTTLLIGVVVIIIAAFGAAMLMRAFRRKSVAVPAISSTGPVLDEKSLLLPKGIYFDKTHTWAFMEQDGTVKVGVDDFLLHMTGPVNRIKMKKAGEKVKKGEEILSVIRNGKQLNLYSPVSGIIREKNEVLESDISILNKSPYSSGWVYRVEPENWQRENQLLFMSEKHRQFIVNEITRIRDFLAGLLRNEEPQLSPVILQDGGMLRDGVLADMSPEVWEEFQSKIIDPSRTVWFYEII